MIRAALMIYIGITTEGILHYRLPVALFRLSVKVAGSYNYSLSWPPCMQLAIKPAVLIYIFANSVGVFLHKKRNSDQE